MTISGEMTKREQVLLKIAVWFLLVFCLISSMGAMRFMDQPDFQRAAAGQHIAIYLVLTPLFAFQLLFMASQLRRNGQTIIDFVCDETSIQFRKLGYTHKETRPLSTVIAILKWRGLGDPVGYRLVFADGARAYVNYSLSNAIALEQRLRARRC